MPIPDVKVDLYDRICQNPDPKESHWKELNYPKATTMRECLIMCSNNKHATGFQSNTDDHFCGCLSAAPGKSILDLMSGPNVFQGNCTIGAYRSKHV